MNADGLETVAAVIRAIDKETSLKGLTLSGKVQVGDDTGNGALGFLVFNDGSETTWEES